VVPVREFSDDRFLLFCTRQGKVKKTALSAYSNIRSVGLNAINIREGDRLIDVKVTSGDDEVILASRKGKAIRFREEDCRSMGRTTEGVIGMRLRKDDVVVGMVTVRPDSTLLVVTEKGMGKRTEVDEYRLQGRGGQGVINMKLSKKTGDVVTIKSVQPEDQVMLITRNGVVNRQSAEEMRVIGRATQGVRLVSLDQGDTIVDVARVIPEDNGDAEEAILAEGRVEGEIQPAARGDGAGAGEVGQSESGDAGAEEASGESDDE
jgi:DNA gyrase subunit A